MGKREIPGKRNILRKGEKVFRIAYTPWNIGIPFAN